jgi:hypothetical protein
LEEGKVWGGGNAPGAVVGLGGEQEQPIGQLLLDQLLGGILARVEGQVGQSCKELELAMGFCTAFVHFHLPWAACLRVSGVSVARLQVNRMWSMMPILSE